MGSQQSEVKLVGLTGGAGSGKDTAAQGLARLGYHTLAFAEPVKRAISAMLGLPYELWEDREWKESPLPGLDVSPRRLAQTLGTEWGRSIVDPDWWLKLAGFRMGTHERVVMSDVRFDNEAEWIRDRGGIVIHIWRPGAEPVESHTSEAGVSPHLVDGQVVNNQDIEMLWLRTLKVVSPETFEQVMDELSEMVAHGKAPRRAGGSESVGGGRSAQGGGMLCCGDELCGGRVPGLGGRDR